MTRKAGAINPNVSVRQYVAGLRIKAQEYLSLATLLEESFVEEVPQPAPTPNPVNSIPESPSPAVRIRRRRNRKFTEGDMNRMISLVDRGWSVSRISTELHRHYTFIWKKIKDARKKGLLPPLPPKSESEAAHNGVLAHKG